MLVVAIVTDIERYRRHEQKHVLQLEELEQQRRPEEGSHSPGMVARVMSNNDQSQWMIPQLFWDARSILQRWQLLHLATALSLG